MITESIITVCDLNIHILEAGSGGHSIVFIHGNSCSADYWNDQLNNEALANHFRLIAIELPGHGSSDKSADYSLNFLSEVLVQIIEKLSIGSYILAGLSFGTVLIGESAAKLKTCGGFFLSSPNITSDLFPPSSYILPNPEFMIMIAGSATKNEIENFAHFLTPDPSSVIVQKFIDSYEKTDPAFRIYLGEASQKGMWTDEFENLIHTGLPVCYVFGEKDKALNVHYMDAISLPPNHSFVHLKDAAHFVNMDQAEIYNNLLLKFCGTALYS
jgi:4,5:9,10-diseco-3-hydroxy-5,9,17-trioxoandrosta-1(10),2-diene-4-oate hydrolase